MQVDTVKRKGLPKLTAQHTSSLQLTSVTFWIPCHVFLVEPGPLLFALSSIILFHKLLLIHSLINKNFRTVSLQNELRRRLATAVPKHNLNQSSSIGDDTYTKARGGRKERKKKIQCLSVGCITFLTLVFLNKRLPAGCLHFKWSKKFLIVAEEGGF